jgi:hypothetical protein
MMVGLRVCFVVIADFNLDSWRQLAVPTIADSKLFTSAPFFNHVIIAEVNSSLPSIGWSAPTLSPCREAWRVARQRRVDLPDGIQPLQH